MIGVPSDPHITTQFYITSHKALKNSRKLNRDYLVYSTFIDINARTYYFTSLFNTSK